MATDPFSEKAAEQFMSGSAVAAKWPTVGYVVEGTVLNWHLSHQRHYDLNEPLYWVGKTMVPESQTTDHSNPVRQLVMEIQGKPTGETWTGLHNTRKALPDDDGKRTLYIKAKLQQAISKALNDAGAKLQEGATVSVERVQDGEQPDKKKQAPHVYKATWTPADPSTAAEDFFAAGVPDDDNPFTKGEAPF